MSAIYRTLPTIIHRLPRPLLALFAGLAPALVTLLLVRTQLQASLLDFVPNGWTDQVWYWHQISTFSEVGFNGGYYVVNEQIAPLRLIHFGPWGPFAIMFYGTLAHFTGWGMVTGVLFNLTFVTLAAWCFFALVRFDRLQIVLAGLVFVALSAILFYMPSIMQESFHHAAALLVTAVFYRLLAKDKLPISRLGKILGLLLLIWIALVRISWLILVFPFFLLSDRQYSLAGFIAALFKTAVIVAVVLFVFQFTASSYGNNSLLSRLSDFYPSPVEGLKRLVGYVEANLQQSFATINDANGLTLDHLQGFQFMLLLGVALVGTVAGQRRQAAINVSRWEMLFHLYNLTSILAISLVFYLPGGFYRVFAPHILITLLLLIAYRRFVPVLVFAVISLLMTGTFLSEYRRQLTPNFHLDHALIDDIRTTFAQKIIYQPDAENPWCNTILYPVNMLNYRVTLPPPGIGITFFNDLHALTWPLNSHYLLLYEQTYATLREYLHVRLVAATPAGTIYRNLDARCGNSAAGG